MGKRPIRASCASAVTGRAFAVAAALLTLLSPALAQDKEKHLTLDNGLRVFLLERHSVPLVHIAVAVNLGTKDETAETSGLIHLLEHCVLFRGTELRSGSEVSREIRNHGAYFNANTGHDLCVFEISLPVEHADFGLRNQKEILFNLSLTQEELDREKEVILEEFSQMEDDPQRFATDLVFQSLFPGHPYGRSVLGDREVIKAATSERMKAFADAFIVPSNCGLAVVGDLTLQEMEDKVRAVFGPQPRREFTPPAFAKAPLLKKAVERREERDVKEGYVVIGCVAPDYNDQNQYAFHVLTQVLGRGINPLLYGALRGRRELAETVSMSYLAEKYGGAGVVVITCQPDKAVSAGREAVRYLRQVRQQNFGKEDYQGEEALYAFEFLGSAKNQIRFGAQQGQESGLAVASALARHLLLADSQDMPDYLERIVKVKSSDLRNAAGQFFGRGEFVTVIVVPRPEEKK
jgi:zinc protease